MSVKISKLLNFALNSVCFVQVFALSMVQAQSPQPTTAAATASQPLIEVKLTGLTRWEQMELSAEERQQGLAMTFINSPLLTQRMAEYLSAHDYKIQGDRIVPGMPYLMIQCSYNATGAFLDPLNGISEGLIYELVAKEREQQQVAADARLDITVDMLRSTENIKQKTDRARDHLTTTDGFTRLLLKPFGPKPEGPFEQSAKMLVHFYPDGNAKSGQVRAIGMLATTKASKLIPDLLLERLITELQREMR
jgi:hypothetical protein